MLSFPGSLKVFIAVEPCDMRCSFNGLHQAVTGRLGEDPKSGSIFAFSNKRRSLLKLLYWDGSGLWVLAKRLEKRLLLLAEGVRCEGWQASSNRHRPDTPVGWHRHARRLPAGVV